MSKKRTLIILGILIAIIPFLGFPREFREVLTVILGLIVSILAFLLKRKLEMMPVQSNTFTQNGGVPPQGNSGVSGTVPK